MLITYQQRLIFLKENITQTVQSADPGLIRRNRVKPDIGRGLGGKGIRNGTGYVWDQDSRLQGRRQQGEQRGNIPLVQPYVDEIGCKCPYIHDQLTDSLGEGGLLFGIGDIESDDNVMAISSR